MGNFDVIAGPGRLRPWPFTAEPGNAFGAGKEAVVPLPTARKAVLRRRIAAALLPRLFRNRIPGHTTRAPPIVLLSVAALQRSLQFVSVRLCRPGGPSRSSR